MDRRNFIRNVAAAGSGLSLEGAQPRENTSVKYAVKGFTCITCAVGLETMLRTQPGVVRVSASFPQHSCEIGYDRGVTSDTRLRQFIADCGFSVE